MVVFALAALCGRAQATFVWNGLGGDDHVATGANWVGGVAPAGISGTDNLTFGASGTFTPRFTTAFAVDDIEITSSAGDYNVTYSGPGALTLNGDIIVQSNDSQPATLFGVPITLSAGVHNFVSGTIEVAGRDVYMFSQIDGTGKIVKYGNGRYIFDHGGNTFSGGFRLEEGTVLVHGDGALGTGTIELVGGTLIGVDYYNDSHVTVLTNNLSLFDDTYIGEEDHVGSLTFTGATVATSGLFAGTANIHVAGLGLLTLNTVGETDPFTFFQFSGGGTIRIGGAATYTGGTNVYDGNDLSRGTVVIFGAGPSLTGSLAVTGNSYLGTEVTTNSQSHFLDLFDVDSTDGVIGFDSPNLASPQSFNENLDFTFFDSTVRYGTATSAIFTGTITPSNSDDTYHFGGRGTLTIMSSLGGVGRGLTVSDGLHLYLVGTNTYDQGTDAFYGGAVVFDGFSSIPASGLLRPNSDGYIGETENVNITSAGFIAMFDLTSDGVVGFDSHDGVTPRVISDPLDLSAFSDELFLGTSTIATLNGLITPSRNEYAFSGFRDGHLTVDSLLTGSNSLVVGLRDTDLRGIVAPPGVTYNPTVTLNGANTFDGGTILQSGELILGNNNALGTGDVEVSGGASPKISTNTAGLVIANNFDFSASTETRLGGTFDYTLTGSLSADGNTLRKENLNTITFAGDNSALGLNEIEVVSGGLILTTDTAIGTGDVFLHNFDGINDAHLAFTSGAPVMGSLSGEDRTTINLGSGTLTIVQRNDYNFAGVISGAGGLIKDGGGTLTLSNTNPYTGNTTLTTGTLVAGHNGSLGTGTIIFNGGRLSVESGVVLNNPLSFGLVGGTLGGNGTYGGAVTIGQNVDLGPGNSVGLLTFTGGLTWGPSGNYDVEVQFSTDARGVGYDSIDVTGGLTFNATLGSPFTINLVSLDPSGVAGMVGDFNSANGYAWLIAHTDGISGFNPANVSVVTTNFTNSLGSGAFHVFQLGNDIYLNFSPVPEPSTYALFALGLGAVFLPVLRRRRR